MAILLPPRRRGYRSVPSPSVGRGSLQLCFPLMGSEVREAGPALSLNRGCGEITTELFKFPADFRKRDSNLNDIHKF